MMGISKEQRERLEEVGHTGECREAMSGPTCFNPACPPCQTPQVVHAEFEDVLAALTALDQYEVALRKIAALGDRVETASDGEHMIVCCHPRELETAAAIARAALTPTKEDHG